MAVNELYPMDMPTDESFLSSSRNLMIIATIFQQALAKYLKIYKKQLVPISFLEFYFKEIKNYEYMFRKQTKEFFDDFEKIQPNFEIVSAVYVHSYFSQCESMVTKGSEKYLVLKDNYINDFTSDMMSSSSKEIISCILNIKKITEHINSSDEVIPFYKSYENYMISELVRQNEFKMKYTGRNRVILNIYDDEEKPQTISAAKRAERLTSERINISTKKGKITKIVIPKLKLPTAYPKTTSFNRFNSKYAVKNFVSVSRMILLLNDLKINGVAYSNNFVEKRKALNEQHF